MEEKSERGKMTELMLEAEGPDGLWAIFSVDDEAGYFYVYKSENQEVLAQIRIYRDEQKFSIHESDVRVMWSNDLNKCGIVIWGKMRGIIRLDNRREICPPFESHDSPGINDTEDLMGFINYLDEDQFIRARQKYWQEIVKRHENIEPRPEQETPIKTNFIQYENGSHSSFALFEDDDTTGYLYLYRPQDKRILRHLHIYDRSKELPILSKDVRVIWSEKGNKCGVMIWGKMRGIIDVENGLEGRVWLRSRDTPGIGDMEWLSGFSTNK